MTTENVRTSKPGAFKQHFISSILALCLGVFNLSSCSPKHLMPAPAEATSTYPGVADALKVDLYFDATLSMQGFTLPKSGSTYQQAIPLLERAVIEGWRGGEAAFFKFGNETAPLPGRAFLDAAKPQFYSDAQYNKKTLIERVIDKAEPDHLTVIITDLFQDNADVNQLSSKLKNKFIGAGLAVGVLGIRSNFEGKVYDVGPDNYSFTYQSSDKPQTGRPFYLLAFGSHANIAHYFATLDRTGMINFPERHALIFSRFITAQTTPFASAKLKTATGISEISSSNLVSQSKRQAEIKAFRIIKGKTEATFTTDWPYEPLPNVLEHPSELEPELTCWKGEDRGTPELTPVENSAAKSALHVSAKLLQVSESAGKLEFKAHLNVSQIPAAGTYSYRIVLRPIDPTLPAWVNDWNMRDADIKAWHSNGGEFNGAKTYNLENFLGTLSGAVSSTRRPEAGELYVYIKVDR